MKTIYSTRGAAKEYCEYAVDIYTGCVHKCEYCYAKKSAERKHKDFLNVSVRDNIIEETRKFLEENTEYKGKTIFLGFSSDPFPTGLDTSKTVEMVKLLKEFGCNVMFCTKGTINQEVIKLLDKNDSVGITITCGDEMAKIYESGSLAPSKRIEQLKQIHEKGIETWISIEPVLEPEYIYNLLESDDMKYITRVKLGKLNHMEISDLTKNSKDFIDWAKYGKKVVEICERRNIEYIVKSALQMFI